MGGNNLRVFFSQLFKHKTPQKTRAAYTYFDRAKKVVCDITIVGGLGADSTAQHSDPVEHPNA